MSTVLVLELVTVFFNCSLSKLLLAVCIFAAVFPALGRCNPRGAESVTFSLLEVRCVHKVLEFRIVHLLLVLSEFAHAFGYGVAVLRHIKASLEIHFTRWHKALRRGCLIVTETRCKVLNQREALSMVKAIAWHEFLLGYKAGAWPEFRHLSRLLFV